MYVYMYVCVCMHVFMYACIYVCTFVYKMFLLFIHPSEFSNKSNVTRNISDVILLNKKQKIIIIKIYSR